MIFEFPTKKQKNEAGQDYVNCKICGKSFTEGQLREEETFSTWVPVDFAIVFSHQNMPNIDR